VILEVAHEETTGIDEGMLALTASVVSQAILDGHPGRAHHSLALAKGQLGASGEIRSKWRRRNLARRIRKVLAETREARRWVLALLCGQPMLLRRCREVWAMSYREASCALRGPNVTAEPSKEEAL
jgi:hypothetical protein